MKAKQQYYKTAFSPLFNCFVGLSHAYQIDGRWLFYGYNDKEGLKDYIFREEELRDFCL